MLQGISIHLLEQKMKRILAILTGMLLLAACVNEQDPTVPVISIIEAPDEFTSEAQRGTITYSITDKHTGAEVSLAVDAVPSADWIYDVDASSPGSVVFSIGENDSENPRTASVSIAAPGAESVSVSVSQEGRSGSSAVQGFAIEVTDITAFEATIKVIPEDPEMTYLLLTGTKEEIDAYESDEELIQYNLDLFSSIAETYGYSLEMLLEDVLLRSGETVTTMDTFLPDTDYYIYVYGMGKDAVPVTAVFKEPLRTAPVPWFDEDIAIKFPEVGTRNISAVFTPGSASFRYLAGNLTAAEYDTYGDDKIVPTMITEIQYVINMYAGLGIEKTWADFTYSGPIQIDSPNLYSGSEYVYYAFGVDNGFYPLGSCTMKYNPRINEEVASLPGFASVHPLQPDSTVQGCLQVYHELARALSSITGMAEFTFGPCAGAHGELTGLMIMRKYHISRNDLRRTKVIVPDSAHGTNPASAAVCGLQVVQVKSRPDGTIDVNDLKPLLDDTVAGIMMTNPNTLGLFETEIREIAELVHVCGGLLYYDGANMNPLLGKVRPGDMGFDIMHLNLHKTFSTPHGGGGPGAGPVGVRASLAKLQMRATVPSSVPTAWVMRMEERE